MNKFTFRHSRRIILVFTSLLMVSYLQSQTSMFGTNPKHSGYYNSHFRANIKLVKKWSFKTRGKIFSTAAISNNMVLIGSDDSCVYAFSTEGNLKWKFKTTGMVRSAPTIKDTLVYFNNYDSMFYAVEINSGKEAWHFKTEGESVHTDYGVCGMTPKEKVLEDVWDCYQSSPVIADSIIYFGSGKNMYALNLNTKSLLWKYTAGNVIHSSPSVSNCTVFFGCWDSKLYAIDALTGTKKWVFATGTDADSHQMEGIAASPTIVDTMVYIGSRDGYVYAINTKNGKQIWKTGFSNSWMPSSFAVSNDTLYTGSSDVKSMFAINRLNGNVYFSSFTNCYNFSTPAITNETGFIGCMNGSLYAFNRLNGRILTSFDTDARKSNFHKAIMEDGSINSRYFNPVSSGEYSDAVEYMRRLYSSGSILSTPVIHNNVVYFGSTDSSLYAVYDDGSCRPDIYVKTESFNLGNISNETDTSFYVRNYGDCLDSVKVALVSPGYMQSLIKLSSQNIIVNPGDSVKVNLNISCGSLNANNYEIILGVTSKSEKYNNYKLRFTFKNITTINSNSLKNKLQIYPNPFSESTIINFNITDKTSIDAGIYNLSGQKLKDFSTILKINNEQTVTWDGTNDSGVRLPSGLYVIYLRQGTNICKQLITKQ